MNIVNYNNSKNRMSKKSRSAKIVKKTAIYGAIIVLAYSAIFAWRFNRPLPITKPLTKNVKYTPSSINVAWPNYGQSAVGSVEDGLLSASGNQKAKPIASVAKVMTALAVLRQKPLSVGSQGPTLTLNSTDVSFYNKYIAHDGSNVKVVDGEKITQYQAMQAMLLPSANNMADSLAVWAYGDLNDFLKSANTLAVSLGMKQTKISDASGFSPATVSTAEDMVLLGQAALKEPVIAEIVNQKTATIPVQGTIANVNNMLGAQGLNGIKTGNTEEAGGCFLGSSIKTLANGQKKTFVAAVLNAPVRETAIAATLPIMASAADSYTNITVANKGQVVGYYQTAWGQNVAAILNSDVTFFAQPGKQEKIIVSLNNISGILNANNKVGELKIDGQNIKSDVVLEKTISPPSLGWKIRRAYQF